MISIDDYVEKYSKHIFVIAAIMALSGFSGMLSFPNVLVDSTSTFTTLGMIVVFGFFCGGITLGLVIWIVNCGPDDF